MKYFGYFLFVAMHILVSNFWRNFPLVIIHEAEAMFKRKITSVNRNLFARTMTN